MNEDKELEEAIKILNELKEKANIEDMDMNDCFNGEHIQTIETVLQAVEKLQKHCKEMIKEKQELTSTLLDSIPRKKIEDILEEVYTDEGIGYELDKDEKPGAICVLRKILKDR